MFCKMCGKTLADNEKICTQCGWKVVIYEKSNMPKKKKDLIKPVAAALTVLVAAGAVGGIILMRNGKSSDDKEELHRYGVTLTADEDSAAGKPYMWVDKENGLLEIDSSLFGKKKDYIESAVKIDLKEPVDSPELDSSLESYCEGSGIVLSFYEDKLVKIIYDNEDSEFNYDIYSAACEKYHKNAFEQKDVEAAGEVWFAADKYCTLEMKTVRYSGGDEIHFRQTYTDQNYK